jgi:hypothetical protein
LANQALERVSPYAQQAVSRVSPYAQQAVSRVSPYAQQAVSRVSPYAQQAAERIAPIATSARQRGARAAHDAVDKFAPVLDQALEKVSPAVEATRSKVSSEIVPKISEALSAAAGAPVVAEATKRGKAVVAAAKGELEPAKQKKGGWVKWLLIAAGLVGVAVFVVRKFLGGQDADWQAARPTTPYAPPRPTETAGTPRAGDTAATAPVVDAMDVDAMDDAHEDPQGGMSAHMMNLQADGAAFPDQPAEGGDMDDSPADVTTRVDDAFAEAAAKIGVDAPGEAATAEGLSDEGSAEPATGSDQDGALLTEPAAAPERASRYQGEGVYIGSEPPEGFTIKGNERSMKYHVPESAGYSRTVAEVWFNSEEAAKQAGFMRAQR